MGLCLSMPAMSEPEISEEVQSYINKGLAQNCADGTLEKALEYFDAAISLDPKCVIAHVKKANVLSHLNRLSEAAQVCENALSIEPTNLYAKYMLGRIKNKAYNIEYDQDLTTNSKEHLAFLKQITKTKAVTAYDYQAKGWAYEKLGDIDSQIRMFVKSLNKSPDVYTAFNVGKTYFDKGEYQLAIHGFNIAVEEDPECFNAWCKLINSHERAGQNEKAREIALDVVKRFPDNATAYHYVAATSANFGEAEEHKGDVSHARELYDESIEYHAKALKLLPNCPLYHCTLAQTYYDRALDGDDIRAMESFNLAFELYKDPKNHKGMEGAHESTKKVFSTQREELLKKLTVLNKVKLEEIAPGDTDAEDAAVQAINKRVVAVKAEIKVATDEAVEILDIKSEATADTVTLKVTEMTAIYAVLCKRK
jgi:tetratricopeptide (TPR) repeat protein